MANEPPEERRPKFDTDPLAGNDTEGLPPPDLGDLPSFGGSGQGLSDPLAPPDLGNLGGQPPSPRPPAGPGLPEVDPQTLPGFRPTGTSQPVRPGQNAPAVKPKRPGCAVIPIILLAGLLVIAVLFYVLFMRQPAQVELGRVVSTANIDDNGCPGRSASSFAANKPIYIAVERTVVPKGTRLAARLIRSGKAVKETEPIVADADLNTCIWFGFNPGDIPGGLASGDYSAEVVVNGRSAETLSFRVR